MGEKYTPGPWVVERRDSNGCEVGPQIMTNRRPDGMRSLIADIAGAPYLEADAGENTHANARLIASAPDLLAACREARALLARFVELQGIPPDTSAPTADVCLIVGNAIKKAEGRS
jgi:hypothetical protein